MSSSSKLLLSAADAVSAAAAAAITASASAARTAALDSSAHTIGHADAAASGAASASGTAPPPASSAAPPKKKPGAGDFLRPKVKKRKRVRVADESAAWDATKARREIRSEMDEAKLAALDAVDDEDEEPPPPFVPSPTFEMVIPGYAFKLGAAGLGYYLDDLGAYARGKRDAQRHEKTAEAEAAAKVRPASRSVAHIEAAPPTAAAGAAGVDVGAALGRLAKHLSASRVSQKAEDKFVKACTMLGALVAERLEIGTAGAFATALDALAPPGRDLTNPTAVRPVLRALFAKVRDKQAAFPDARRADVGAWYLQGCVANNLCTDDSFLFARACRDLTAGLEAMPEAPAPDATRKALMLCVERAYGQLKLGRATSRDIYSAPAVRVLAKAADRRLRFADADRARLDIITAEVRGGGARAPVDVGYQERVLHPVRQVTQGKPTVLPPPSYSGSLGFK